MRYTSCPPCIDSDQGILDISPLDPGYLYTLSVTVRHHQASADGVPNHLSTTHFTNACSPEYLLSSFQSVTHQENTVFTFRTFSYFFAKKQKK